MDKIRIIILAAGKGVRMQSELPKILIPLHGKMLITYLLDSIKKSGIDDKPAIIVGQQRELVMQTLGPGYEYIIQEKQLGTGHAVLCAKKYLENKTDNVIILCGDHPFPSRQTIQKLAETHVQSSNILTMATAILPDFNDWRSLFYKSFSRIIRDQDGNILRSVEFKDANEAERKIKEINPFFFCFKAKWLWDNLETIKNNNVQQEYYLTDLVKKAIEEKQPVGSIMVNPREALGVNSKEDLEILEELIA